MNRLSRCFTVCTVASVLLSDAAPAQRRPALADSAMFVIRIGNDTSRIMWLIRDGQRLTTVSANRIPSLRVLRGHTVLDPDWSLRELDQSTTNPGAPDPRQVIGRTRIWRASDSTFVETGLAPNERRVAYAGGGLFINTPHYYETLALIGSAPSVGDSLVGQHFAGTLFPPQRFVVRRLSADRATAWSRPLGIVRLKLGARGEVMEFDGAGTSALNFSGERRPWRDVDATIADLLEAERAGRVFGALSGRDSLRVATAGANIHIDYGRPTMRGRVIFGNIVPFDTVWRTGANRATHFTTDRPLDFGGRVLPSGAYTLWTLPTRAGWTLMINTQTAQWGTEYDASRDLLRLPMTVVSLPAAVDQFTITVDPRPGGGILRFAWEKTEARAAFTAK